MTNKLESSYYDDYYKALDVLVKEIKAKQGERPSSGGYDYYGRDERPWAGVDHNIRIATYK